MSMSTHPQALVCPRCGQLVSGDQPRCPRCGLLWRPVGGKMAASALLVRSVVALNAIIFVLSLLLAPGSVVLDPSPLAFLSVGDRSLLLLGATGTLPVIGLQRWWTLISANYLHGSLLHLLFNMAAFYQLARMVIATYGTARFVVVYTLSGAAGFALSVLAGIQLTIGASAAVCGLMGALLYYGRSRGGAFGNALYRQVGGWALFIFLFGLAPGINNWGHGGGLVAGAALGYLLGYTERRPESTAHRKAARLCMAATLLCLAWGVAGAVRLTLAG